MLNVEILKPRLVITATGRFFAQVIIVLTDGRYGNDLTETRIQQVVQDVLQENVKVLTFALGQGAATENLTALACAMRGSLETLDTPLNPLFGMRSYFSFLARSRLAVHGTVSWQQEYNNFDWDLSSICVTQS